MSKLFLSFYFLLNQIQIKHKYTLSLIFTFSFWSLFIFEIDALSQLGASTLFISGISILIANKKNLFFDYYNFNLFLIISISLFFVYPEQCLIAGYFTFFYILFKKNILNIFHNEKWKILFGIIIFIIATLPSFKTNYLSMYSLIKFASISSVDWWGYYGLFLTETSKKY